MGLLNQECRGRGTAREARESDLTNVNNVQHHHFGYGHPEPVGGLHPNLIGREEGQVLGDMAGVGACSVILLAGVVSPIPPGMQA